MNPPRIDPDRLKTERHDADLGTDRETAFGHAGDDERAETAIETDVMDQKGASPIPNAD